MALEEKYTLLGAQVFRLEVQSSRVDRVWGFGFRGSGVRGFRGLGV